MLTENVKETERAIERILLDAFLYGYGEDERITLHPWELEEELKNQSIRVSGKGVLEFGNNMYAWCGMSLNFVRALVELQKRKRITIYTIRPIYFFSEIIGKKIKVLSWNSGYKGFVPVVIHLNYTDEEFEQAESMMDEEGGFSL